MPKSPPSDYDFWKNVDANLVQHLMEKVAEPTVRSEYVHWNKLQYLKPPEGLTHIDWWRGLRLRRCGGKRVPLVDKMGLPFTFNLVDPLLEVLHHVDSLARGMIQQPEPVTNPATRDSYLVRSLIEESITSSQLEGASTTRAVAKKMIREGRAPRDRSERMILNNYRAMSHIREVKTRELDVQLLFEIHGMVTDGTLDDPTGVGRFRRPEEQVVVGDHFGEIFHVPPAAQELDDRIDALCEFANGKTPEGFIHPVLRSMILHFWLAYDHPFIDGNGRTARALFYWSMLKQGYWLFEYITISRIIHRAPTKYGEAFLHSETDANDLTYFLLYHADVIRKAIDALYQYIDNRTKQLAAAERDLRGLTELNYRQRELIGHALKHSGQTFTIEAHRNSHQVAYQTARTDLMDLVSRGLMNQRKTGKRLVFIPVPDLADKLRVID
jgi:Fic family protein